MSESIAEFIKKYGKPYDPETDDYDTGPFQKSFDNASKSSKIYNMHMYWTKQDPYVVKQFIEHYTKPGDIVLDAFCGTGMTGVAAMMCGRHAVLSEISPACIHISNNYGTPCDPDKIRIAFNELLAKIGSKIKWMYETQCHKCGNKNANIIHTVLSDVIRCPRCNEEILFANKERWKRMQKGEKFKIIICEYCGYKFDKNDGKFVHLEPIELRISCNRCKLKGKEIAKELNEDDCKRYIEIHGGPSEYIQHGPWEFKLIQLDKFCELKLDKVYQTLKEKSGRSFIEPMKVVYWYPRTTKLFGHLLKSANAKHHRDMGLKHIFQLFSRRNLIALSIIWQHINQWTNPEIKNKMKLLFTSFLYNVSLMVRWHYKYNFVSTGMRTRKGTLYIPSLVIDVNPNFAISTKARNLVNGFRELHAFKKHKKSEIFCKKMSATVLRGVPEDSIDYLYYDPPYGSNIMYSEVNVVWESWLGEITRLDEEIIENKYQNKSRSVYEDMLFDAMKEAFRVLKPGRWFTMVYSYSDPSMYRTIQRIAHNAGFIDEGEILHVNSKAKSAIQMVFDKAQQRFLVINFKKPKDAKKKAIKKSENIDYDVIRVIQDFLTKQPGKTRDYIYDQVIKQLFSTVQIQKFDLNEILKNFFRKVGDEWYAPGTLLTRKQEGEQQMDWLKKSPPEHPEKEVILQLQEFLKRYKRVPYSELREFYLRKIDIPLERNFDDLIKENFKVEEGKVRLPTPVEQTRMQDISAQYQIRVIRHFLDDKLDRIPQTEELSNWVEFCYQNEFYKEGSQIFNLLGEDYVELNRYKKLKKIAEVCRIKSE